MYIFDFDYLRQEYGATNITYTPDLPDHGIIVFLPVQKPNLTIYVNDARDLIAAYPRNSSPDESKNSVILIPQ